MKAFIIVCLAAAAMAAPEADSDALLYGRYGYNTLGYSGLYANRFYGSYARPSIYGSIYSPFYNRYGIYKREAEAEADPLFYAAGALPHTVSYSTGVHAIASPAVYSHSVVAAPTVAYAKPAVVAAPAVYATPAVAAVPTAVHTGVQASPLAIRPEAPAAFPAVVGGYAAAGRYVAKSAGGVSHIAKREAEADSDAYLYSAYGLNYGLNYGYGLNYPRALAYNSAAYVRPYAFGARYYNGWY